MNAFDPVYLFHVGKNYQAYSTFSPHKEIKDGKQGWTFRVWAPHAKSVSVVGNFNSWDRTVCTMNRISDGGVWETFVEGLQVYDIYKYSIETKKGDILLKSDPFALHTETAPQNASKLYDISVFKWTDSKWIGNRRKYNPYKSPVNIYEVNAASWKRNPDGTVYSYRMLADELIPYVVEMNYTHIELMPITEFPFDGSWGYQVTGMFAPTSRYGTPEDFAYFVNKCHESNIGVIIDWVPAHFPKDEFGLYKFDGDWLYEYSQEGKREHKEWGTVVYDYEKAEVKSFLISSAKFWQREYHIDGFRCDAVASMLYLDYSRKAGEWKPNKFGGKTNLEAIEFLKEFNRVLLSDCSGVMTIAEESTAFPMVTKPDFDGGLGFNFKWNMGWMNDTLVYCSMDPFFRSNNHDKMTFSVTYAFSENYVLPFSHDEVVHGKRSLISKMPGGYEQQFDELKTMMGYHTAFPGKKLNFMGNEIAQFIEWRYYEGIEWFLLDYEKHNKFRTFIKDLNVYYKSHTEMYSLDCDFNGFRWIVVDDNAQNVLVFMRFDEKGEYTIAVMNFSPVERKGYKFGVPDKGVYKVELSSDLEKYGGKSKKRKSYSTAEEKSHGFENVICMDIPSNSVQYLKYKK